ncbi:unnamed protein product [Danaus chrysippus]|uniref:(African queen) hypothetical protein n=1 Tax=Danaus chrysippus TaxID=151541 RepID=A0A8J2R0M3_9NEOP|nr:unnamed protein product [Danaus chrysippus]
MSFKITHNINTPHAPRRRFKSNPTLSHLASLEQKYERMLLDVGPGPLLLYLHRRYSHDPFTKEILHRNIYRYNEQIVRRHTDRTPAGRLLLVTTGTSLIIGYMPSVSRPRVEGGDS